MTERFEREMRVYASEEVKRSYGQVAGQFGIHIDLETTPLINSYVAPN